MAHTTESANLVWQKVRIANDSLGIDPAIVEQLLELKKNLATAKKNPNLKFTAIDGTDAASNDVVISDTTNTALVAIVLKKKTGTVAGFPAISAHASAIQAAKVLILGSGATAGKQIAAVYPKGFKVATGMTYNSVTAYNGTTKSDAADQADGYAISIDAEIA